MDFLTIFCLVIQIMFFLQNKTLFSKNPDILVQIYSFRAEVHFIRNGYYNKTMKSYLGYTGWDLLIFCQNCCDLKLWLKILNPLPMCATKLLYRYPVPAKNLPERLILKINCNQYRLLRNYLMPSCKWGIYLELHMEFSFRIVSIIRIWNTVGHFLV